MSNNNSNSNVKNEKSSPFISKRKKGNLETKSVERKKMKQQKVDLSNHLNVQLSAEKKASPLILMELSKKQFHQLKKNIIHLSSCEISSQEKKSVLHNQTHYSEIQYGDEIQRSSKCITQIALKMNDLNEKIDVNLINIQELKKSMIIITTDKENVNLVSKNNILITSNVTPTESSKSFKGSGKVVLAIIKDTNTKDPETSDWNDALVDRVSAVKPNICVPDGPNSHFNSQGIIAAWGNKALYGRATENSTVGQYVNELPTKKKTVENITSESQKLEALVAKEVDIAVSNLKKYFVNISGLIAPILRVAYNKQEEDGNINLKEVPSSQYGLWQSELCVNAITRDFHTERDVSYTLISVPYQVYDNNHKQQPRNTFFLFKLSNNLTIGFKMYPKTSFIFNGNMLTHRQFSEDGYELLSKRKNINNYYNIACYGNERLFNHMRKSFRREIGYEK